MNRIRVRDPQFVAFDDRVYLVSKRAFDIAVSLFCVPVLIGICLVLSVLNPFWNAGPLFFVQQRTGKGGREFAMLKFRSMSAGGQGIRGADDPLEKSRITPLGSWLREHKVDELPQILNVLCGHMSLVGPRPEMSAFIPTYRASISEYDLRETFRPGMTGYAQVVQGYCDSIDMVRQKTELDLHYIRNAGWRLDLYVILVTAGIVIVPRRAPPPSGRPSRRTAAWADETESEGAGSARQVMPSGPARA